MDIVDTAIHPVICQKSSDNIFVMAFLLENSFCLTVKNILSQNVLALQRYFGARSRLMVHYKSKIRYNYVIWFV